MNVSGRGSNHSRSKRRLSFNKTAGEFDQASHDVLLNMQEMGALKKFQSQNTRD